MHWSYRSWGRQTKTHLRIQDRFSVCFFYFFTDYDFLSLDLRRRIGVVVRTAHLTTFPVVVQNSRSLSHHPHIVASPWISRRKTPELAHLSVVCACLCLHPCRKKFIGLMLRKAGEQTSNWSLEWVRSCWCFALWHSTGTSYVKIC